MGTRVVRVGNTVRRRAGFWSAAVHALLHHLESVGFPAPRVLEARGDSEVLTWIDGDSGPEGWARVVPETGLRRWAALLRTYHDAVAAYRPSPASVWSSGTGGAAPGELVCHGDFGPWNGVWRGGVPVGLIDWDHARPAPPMFDIAYALEYAVPFRDDGTCLRSLRYPAPPDRRRRIEVFCEAYGIAVPDDIVSRVAGMQLAVLRTVEDLARRGVEPQRTWAADGYLDEVRARIRWTESLRLGGPA